MTDNKCSPDSVRDAAERMKIDLLDSRNHGCLVKAYEHLDNFIIDGHVSLLSLARAALPDPAQASWQPITTNPFVSAKRYLITEGDRLAIPFVGFRIYEAGPWQHDGYGEVYPTHWMDLPDTSTLTSTVPLPAAVENVDLYAWPVGCHSPNSCRRNGRCMYVGCKHDGAPRR